MAFGTEMLRRLSGWIRKQLRETHEIRGFRVLVDNSRPDIETSTVLERLDDALALVERYQPHRYWHLKRDLSYIWIARYPCRGAYFPRHRTCLTELTFLARRDISPAVVASSILHEGVHARIDRFRHHFGMSSERTDAAREERLCRTGELSFGRSLPADLAGPIIERATQSLALEDEAVAPVVDWELARARQDVADADAARLPRRLTKRQRDILQRDRDRGHAS
jgi:hypothetical protein